MHANSCTVKMISKEDLKINANKNLHTQNDNHLVYTFFSGLGQLYTGINRQRRLVRYSIN